MLVVLKCYYHKAEKSLYPRSHTMQSGGVTLFKFHLTAINASKHLNGKENKKQESLKGGQRNERVSGAGGNSQPPQQVRRTQSGQDLYKTSGAKQKNIKDMFKGVSIRDKMGSLILKFFIYDNVPPHKVGSHHFNNMIIGAQESGIGVQPPLVNEIRHKYLDIEYKETKEPSGPVHLDPLHIYTTNCKGHSIFLKSIDASNKIKDHQYIYRLLKDVVKEVGEKNIVQIFTDNGSVFVKAAHCIDSIFEDIGKKDIVASVIHDVRAVTNFIYNHVWLLSQMREVCKDMGINFEQVIREEVGVDRELLSPALPMTNIPLMEIMEEKMMEMMGMVGMRQEVEILVLESLDDNEGNPYPHISSHAREMGINFEQVIREEVGIDRGVIVSSSSYDQHTSDGNNGEKDDGDDGDGVDEARG
ncbi:hypothetical protein Ddye_016676 [Dipteronia dyeriana]|uniref:DUF659 domain-containing protein n=1 Tax=Dipteronia dyeriana TaxID=168575 RepID=A0AAD9X0J0_9ROSI|nr:hypothetical protein Ddye_016676 [Dipteronia dyeriana]